MANPYHDSFGRFCSRDGMLASIHQLAASGQVPAYLALKSEFDEIDKGNITVPKTLISGLFDKAKISTDVDLDSIQSEDVEGILSGSSEIDVYSNLSGEALYELVGDLAYKTADTETNYTSEILKILEASNYNDQALYAAVDSPGLSYEDKVKLVNEHDTSLYYILAEQNPEEVFSKNKEDFKKALNNLAEKKFDNKEGEVSGNYALIGMTKALANNASSSEDIATAIKVTPYNAWNSKDVSYAIMSSPYTTKELAITYLDKSIESGGTGYYEARSALNRRLAKSGIRLEEAEYPKKSKIFPFKGKPSQEILAKLEEEKSKTKDKDSVLADHPLKMAQVQADVYEENFNALRRDTKKNNPRSTEDYRTQISQEIRLEAAEDYLAKIVDSGKLRTALADIEF